MNLYALDKLSKLVTNATNRKPKIMLNPKKISRFTSYSNIDFNVNVDPDTWTITDEMKSFIENLNANTNLSVEEKILNIYQKLCDDYTYDDNVLSYIKKYDEDRFGLPDFYGRDTDENWKQNRAKHNRRNCFEISRLLAESITTMLAGLGIEDSYETCILWDEAITHYFVGLVSDDYCITLDLDDFEEIKDLTRMKTGLTIKGIKILEDPDRKFQTALNNFNSGRCESAIDHITSMIESAKNSEKNNGEKPSKKIGSIHDDDIQFLKYTIKILKDKYNIDSAGLFEYMKEIVDTKLGPETRKKVWKEVPSASKDQKKHTRCLVVEIGKKLYIVDVTGNSVGEIFHTITKENISNDPEGGPYTKYQHKSWDTPYDGR